MGTDVTKCYLRRNSVKRWNAGRLRNGLSEPTKEEYAIFLTGFNMGYECCKTKRLKEIDSEPYSIADDMWCSKEELENMKKNAF